MKTALNMDMCGIAIVEPDDRLELRCPSCGASAHVAVGYVAESGALTDVAAVLHCNAGCGEPPHVMSDPHLDPVASTVEIPLVPDNPEVARWYPSMESK